MTDVMVSQNVRYRRGWWLAVEFEKRSHGRKKFDEAIGLLGAGERYDLILENGKTLARGIFDDRADLKSLHRLITTVSEWTGSALHTPDGVLEKDAVRQLVRMMACANGTALCRSHDPMVRFACLGCHLEELKIRLAGFSQPVCGDRPFWFSFYNICPKETACYELDEHSLRRSMARSRVCPLHPETSWIVADRLPKTLDLKTHRDFRMWITSDERRTPNRARLFPCVVPRNVSRYNQWMENVILKDLFDRSRENKT